MQSGKGTKAFGLIIFIVGIALLVLVFSDAYRYFHSDTSGIEMTVEEGSANSPTERLGESATKMIVRIGLLVVMAITGSLVASRGIHLYFASKTALECGENP